jgi:hypothetical protein
MFAWLPWSHGRQPAPLKLPKRPFEHFQQQRFKILVTILYLHPPGPAARERREIVGREGCVPAVPANRAPNRPPIPAYRDTGRSSCQRPASPAGQGRGMAGLSCPPRPSRSASSPSSPPLNPPSGARRGRAAGLSAGHSAGPPSSRGPPLLPPQG